MNPLLLVAVLAGAWQAGAEPARALALHLADGKVSYHLIQPNGGIWTGAFPRIDRAVTDRHGKRLFAVDIRHRPEGTQLVADVSLLYGGANDVKVPIGTMPLTQGNTATFDLTAFGVQPIRLSVVDIPPIEAVPVPAAQAPPELEIQVQSVPGVIPRYDITATNRGVKPIMRFGMLAHQEGTPASVSRRLSKPGGMPVLMPGESYSFKHPLRVVAGPDGGPVWLGSTRFEMVEVITLDLDQTIADYCAAWSEPDVARRRALLDKVWAPGGTYADPTAHVAGREALVHQITGFHQTFPGVKIVVTSKVDFHHGVGRFSWRMVEGSGNTRIEGIDFVEFAADGRINRIVGFFGPLKQ